LQKTTDLPGEVSIRRARAARARKQLARPGSLDWQQADAAEQQAIAALKNEFGVLDARTLDWLIERKLSA
jgi:hypothetical protein